MARITHNNIGRNHYTDLAESNLAEFENDQILHLQFKYLLGIFTRMIHSEYTHLPANL